MIEENSWCKIMAMCLWIDVQIHPDLCPHTLENMYRHIYNIQTKIRHHIYIYITNFYYNLRGGKQLCMNSCGYPSRNSDARVYVLFPFSVSAKLHWLYLEAEEDHARKTKTRKPLYLCLLKERKIPCQAMFI